MNCITIHDNIDGTEHLTTTVSNTCLDNLKVLELIGGFRRFSIDIHSNDAPKTRTNYKKVSEFLHNVAFPNMSQWGLVQILTTKKQNDEKD